MTALNFPSNPSDGDTFENYIYEDTKGVWRIQPNVPGVTSRFYVSETTPTNPKNGEIWLNSTDGNTYIYYVDGDSGQWIEIGGDTGFPPILGDLNDVEIYEALDGQALVYDLSADKWVNETPASTLDSLTDTTITTPADGEVLTYDGSDWVNQVLPSPGFTASETITASNASWPVPTLDTPIVKVTVIGGGGGGGKYFTQGGTGGTTTFDAGGAGTVTAAGGVGGRQGNGIVIGPDGTNGFASGNGGQGASNAQRNGATGGGGVITVAYLNLSGISDVDVTIGAGGDGGTDADAAGDGGRGEVIVEYVAG
jgi:hypothetical protein